jgi:endonuclease YncB( thermonuclease family)
MNFIVREKDIVRFSIITICCFVLADAQAEPFVGKVVGIADGDTLTVLTASKKQHKIRLAEIDAPENAQPFGTKSKRSLSDVCFGKEAEVTPFVKDRYQRIVARVKWRAWM